MNILAQLHFPARFLQGKHGEYLKTVRLKKCSVSSVINPGDSIMESSDIFGSPKTPVKKVMSKTRAARKDLVCLLCGMSLVGERCTFNVENHHDLRIKLHSILEESVDFTVQSSRVCRTCGRQTESLEKRYSVVMQQMKEFRAKYSSSSAAIL